MRIIASIVMGLFYLARLGYAQGPRLPPPFISWVAQRPSLVSARPPFKVPTALSGDSVAIRRTYWLEGGLIGAVLVGALGTQLCKLGEGSRDTCSVKLFFLAGGFIGFPAGALIGGRFTKHGPPPPKLALEAVGAAPKGSVMLSSVRDVRRSLSAIR